MGTTACAAMLAAVLLVGGNEAPGDDRLYGRVVTAGGRVYEGFLRWDRNEGSWADILNGSKEIPWEYQDDARRLDEGRDRARRERSVEILGLRISWGGDDEPPSSASSGIRFGHLHSLAVLGNRRALLTLKSGEEVELEGGSSDVGSGFRGLVVDDPRRGSVELEWRDLDVVEFLPVPEDAPEPAARRLFGTLRTRDGATFTGFVAWDVDEILSDDVLDGEERGRDREIPFAEIAAIERSGSSGARVVLRDGEEVVLRGTNDVDEDNRGIAVSDPALGQVTVSWDDFEEVVFRSPTDADAGYGAFDGGHPLYGSVETADGERLEGYLRWDNDEAWSWELLDGRMGGVDLDVEFGRIESIRRMGSRGAEVTLRDGRRLEMEGSNDVDDGNKGIYVTLADGEMVRVRWRDFREVTFSRP